MTVANRTADLEPRWKRLVRVYWTLCKISFQERIVYRWNTLIFVLLALLPALIGIYLWTTIYGERNEPAMITYVTTYYVVATWVGFRIAAFHWMFMDDIRAGKMASSMLRPLSYPTSIFWYEVGGRSFSTLFTLPPFILLAVLLGNSFSLPVNPLNWLLALVAFLISFVINYFLTGALGLITIWNQYPMGFFVLYDLAGRWLGGVLVPLTLLPDGLRTICEWLPFAYIYNLPVRLVMGVSGEYALRGFAIQFVWLVLSGLLFRLVWGKAVRRHEVYEAQS